MGLSLEEIIIYGGDIFRYIIGKKLYENGVENLPDEATKLVADAIEAYEEGDTEKAFRLLKKAFSMTDVKSPTDLAMECIKEMNSILNKVVKVDKEKLMEKLLNIIEELELDEDEEED